MFLTTETSIPGKAYIALRVICGVGIKSESGFSESKASSAISVAVGYALAALEREASQLGADGVIGVHLSISTETPIYHAAVMGTAIKFQQP